jgi:peptidoglycan/LPS O-acetylase OafA/YrhL
VAGELATQSPLAAFVLYNGTALAAAALLYVAVERPGLRMRARIRPAAPRHMPAAHDDKVPFAR